MNYIKQICVELANLAKREHYFCEDSWYSCPKAEGGCANDAEGDECTCGADAHNAKVNELLAAALAEPEGPTDEELLCIAAKSIEPYDQILPGEYEPESNSAVEVYGSELIIYARAVLARWGRPAPAPQPIPVTERLPKAEDCDAEGRCWWGAPVLLRSVPVSWRLVPTEDRCGSERHWLPASTLPLPK